MRTLASITMIAAVIALLGTVTACKSAATPTDTPGVDRLGEYILRNEAADVEVVMAYRHAAKNLGEEWLILEVALSSPTGQTATIERDSIFVQTPDGTRVPLATQEEFGEAYSGLRSRLRQANIHRDPMDYFPPSRIPCGLELFAEPGAAVTHKRLSVDDQRACEGKLFFRLPGGVQAGRYVLGMDLEETRIRIPFTL
jgi:hypothetical protein